jgi:multiple sugar transport system permease protein
MRASPLRRAVVYLGAACLLVWTLLPLYWLAAMSFMYNSEVVNVPAHLFPQQPTLANYIRMFGGIGHGPNGAVLASIGQAALVRRGWLNSLIVAVGVTVLTMLIAVPLAYALGRLSFRLKTGLLFTLISSRAYPPIAVLIPFSYIFTLIGLQGSQLSLIIIYLTITIPLVGWILTGFFSSLPRSLEKLARTDGLTRWQAFYRVMVPIASPGVAACAVIAFLSAWNEFTFSLILTSGSPSQTFPPALSGMFFQISDPAAMAAASFLGIIPPAILALVFQNRIRRINIVDPL